MSKYNKVHSLHTFPSDAETRRRCVVAIQRDYFRASSNTSICRHFKKEDVCESGSDTGWRLSKPEAAPALFEWNNFSVPIPRPGVWERSEQPAAEGDTPNEEAIAIPGDHDYASAPNPTVIDLALEENTTLREEILQLRMQIEKLTMKQRFGIHYFAGSDSDIRFFIR